MRPDSEYEGCFEERAENLSRDEISRWTAEAPNSEFVLRKLTGPGAKLLAGPRGCGKSTFLKVAYYNLLASPKVFPVYVNYSKSLALEPLYHSNANATILFRQWVIHKLIIGIVDALSESDFAGDVLDRRLYEGSKKFIASLEVGIVPSMGGDGFDAPMGINDLKEIVDSVLESVGRSRCVLLLDDAAHAFSQEQQREFFEIFRELTSRVISPKAAVYPGATSYSKNFHIGHDAELIEAWVSPADPKYLPMMRALIKRRFPSQFAAVLEEKQELTDLLAYSCFGVPRAFINSIGSMIDVDSGVLGLNRRSAYGAIKEVAESQRQTFRSLARKLPRFKEFIELGEHLVDRSVEAIRSFNRTTTSARRKALEIAVEDTASLTFERIVQLLQYAGVVRDSGAVSRGIKGRFLKYEIHSAILLDRTALAAGKSPSIGELVQVFRDRSAHAFVRRKEETLVGEERLKACALRLPGCGACGAARISEEQRFCASCGGELVTASIYKELLNSGVIDLPITDAKKRGINEFTSLRSVQDILNDEEGMLRRVPGIGQVWQARIRNAAEEYVSV